MGGAHTAVAQGPSAAYWNPAGLGQLFDVSGVELAGSIHATATGGVLRGANDLNQLARDCAAGLTNCQAARISKAIDRMDQDGNGAMFDSALAASARVRSGVFFIHSLTFAGGTPIVDHANATPATISANSSKLTLRGGNFIHFGFGTGREIGKTGFSIGANAKLIGGKVGFREIYVVTEAPGPSSFRRYDANTKTSVAPAFDLGAFWDLRESFPELIGRPRLALVGRDLNRPKFAQPSAALNAGDRAHYTLEPQVRAGLAFQPLEPWTISADLDVTENLTPIAEFRSRILAVGTELKLFAGENFMMPLRLGVQKNIAHDDSAAAYTAGSALEFSSFRLDVSGMISSTATEIQGERMTRRVPNSIGGAFRLAWEFGAQRPGS